MPGENWNVLRLNTQEDNVKKLAAGFAVAALLLVVAGCPLTQKTAELEEQIETQTARITELEEQVQTLTAERTALEDSLAKLEAALAARTPAGRTPTRTPAPAPGSRQPLPPTKK